MENRIIFSKTKDSNPYHMFSMLLVCILFQCIYILLSDIPVTIGTKIEIIVFFSLLQIFVFLARRIIHNRLNKNGNIKLLLYLQSTCFFMGSTVVLLAYPFFVTIALNFELYDRVFYFFLLELSLVFIIAVLYTCKMDPKRILEDSLIYYKNSKGSKFNIIYFVPDTAPKGISPIIYTYYISLLYFCFMAAINRNNNDQETYYLLLSVLSLCSILLYSELCYLLIIIKSFFQKNNSE
ncbi:hypothetical protein CVP05_12095 [Conservatibacter flavescens]|uniref:Uncharacterized protein n=1 Tax=Conservatibacter flavescens TaxID=28161 RepID=A0A2M8RZI2_9PAST|nr:hypothetical protein CVP05_12095 [Conservatibacter flavescens]